MKKHSLLKSFLILVSLCFFGSASAQVTFQGISDSTAIVDEPFTSTVSYTVTGGNAPTFSLPLHPGDMSINSSGVISYTPDDIYSGGRVVVRAVNSVGTYECHFNLYVSDEIACSADLISYFKFNESGGTTFADYQGGPNATSATSLTAASGRVGGAELLSPASITTEFMSIPDNDQYEWTVNDDFSFAVWIYPLGKPAFSQNIADDQVLFYLQNSVTGAYIVFGLDGQDIVTDILKPKIKLMNSAGDAEVKYVSDPEVTTDTWHHMAFAYDAQGGGVYYLRVYLDGVKIENPFNAFTSSADFYSDSPLNIGWYDYPGYYVPFNGRMDEMLIYNKALTDAEVEGIYDDGVANQEHCQPGNTAPEFINNFPTNIDQGSSCTIQLATYDIDGDGVQINYTSLPDWMQYNSGPKTLTNKTGRPNNDDVGTEDITLTAYDGTVQVTRTFPITVDNVNDAPTFTSSQGNITMDEDTPFSYSITYDDIDDGDVVTLSSPTDLPTWLTLNTGTNTLSGTPTNDVLGTSPSEVFPVTLRVTDLSLAYAEQSFNITVNNVNDPPVITDQNDIYTDEGIPVTITPDVAFTEGVNISDVDNVFPDDFSLTVSSGTNYTVTPPNTVNPAANFSGILSVPIILSDGEDDVDYILSVNVNFVNEDPDIDSDPETDVNEYELYEYTMEVSDNDIPLQDLVMRDSVLPNWLTFVPETGYLSGTPRYSDVGDTVVVLCVTDGYVETCQSYTLTVDDYNYAPEITSMPEEEWSVGTVYQYNFTATDTNEDDALTFSALLKPDWLNFETQATQALLHGVPTEENAGDHNILLQVSDGSLITQQSFTLTISVTGIENTLQGTVLLYPIPADTRVYFEYSGLVNGTIIEIVNLNGSQVTSKIIDDTEGKTELDVDSCEPGIYIYRIIENDQITTGKIVIE